MDNTNMGGYDIRDFDIGYVYECQYWCQLEPACNYFTILKSGQIIKFLHGQYQGNDVVAQEVLSLRDISS